MHFNFKSNEMSPKAKKDYREEAEQMLEILEAKLQELEHELELATSDEARKAEIEQLVAEYRAELLAEAEKDNAEKKVNIEAQISLLKELIATAKEQKEEVVNNELPSQENEEEPVVEQVEESAVEVEEERPLNANPFFRG